jgi:MFS family permease
MVLFTCGCIIFATAKSMSLIIVGRLFMGLGGGGMDILGSIIICDIITLRERALYIGINMAFCALGTVAGPILGGSLSELVTWR